MLPSDIIYAVNRLVDHYDNEVCFVAVPSNWTEGVEFQNAKDVSETLERINIDNKITQDKDFHFSFEGSETELHEFMTFMNVSYSHKLEDIISAKEQEIEKTKDTSTSGWRGDGFVKIGLDEVPAFSHFEHAEIAIEDTAIYTVEYSYPKDPDNAPADHVLVRCVDPLKPKKTLVLTWNKRDKVKCKKTKKDKWQTLSAPFALENQKGKATIKNFKLYSTPSLLKY